MSLTGASPYAGGRPDSRNQERVILLTATIRTSVAASALLSSSLFGGAVAAAQESPDTLHLMEAAETTSDSSAGLMSDAEVEEARANGNPFFNITESTQNGFRAEVENASIRKAGDTLSLVDKNGNESLVLESHVYLKDGSAVKVNYETTGNTIKGTFGKPVPKDQVYVRSTGGTAEHSAAGCAAGALSSIGAVAGGAAGIMSAPATGPVGPMMTVAAASGMAGTIGATAAECSGQ